VARRLEDAIKQQNWEECESLEAEKEALHKQLPQSLSSHESTLQCSAASPEADKPKPIRHNMTITELLAPGRSLPPRVCLTEVRVCAIGKVSFDSSYGKGVGKSGMNAGVKGKSGKAAGKAGGKLVGKKGGRQAAMEQVCLHVAEEANGTKVPIHWKGTSLSIDGLEKALLSVTDARPVVLDNGSVFLELDNASSVKVVKPAESSVAIHTLLTEGLWTLAEAGQETIGSYVDVLLKVVRVTTKDKTGGGTFVQVNFMDKENTPLNLAVFDYSEEEFTPGSVYLALGLVVRPGRMQTGQGWCDDFTWGQTKFSGWRTAFVDVRILVVRLTGDYRLICDFLFLFCLRV
jgi:hypothetical protein